MSIPEVVARTGRSRGTLYRDMDAGVLPYWTSPANGRRRINTDDVDAYEADLHGEAPMFVTVKTEITTVWNTLTNKVIEQTIVNVGNDDDDGEEIPVPIAA